MYLQEKNKPKWKLKQELFKTQSFDSSLTELGKNGAFLNATEIDEELKSPTQVETDAKIDKEVEDLDAIKSETKPCTAE